MSHNGNTELLLCLFEEEVEVVQKDFQNLPTHRQNMSLRKEQPNVSGTKHNESKSKENQTLETC